MANGHRILAASVWCVVFVWIGPACADERPVVTVKVAIQFGMTAIELEKAKGETSRIFGAAGIQLSWTSVGAAVPRGPSVTVSLAAHPGESMTMVNGGPKRALAITSTSASRIFVFCARIESLAARSGEPFHAILGRVIAHEIGHLLLPGRPHARSGVMASRVDYRSEHSPSFSNEESALMRWSIASTTANGSSLERAAGR